MTRKFLSCLLAITCSWPLASFAADSASAAAPAISDTQAMRFFNASDLAAFNDSVAKMAEGQSKIESGTILKNHKQDPNEAVKEDVDADHKKGDAMIKEGTAELKAAKAAHEKLLKVAIANRDQMHANIAATGAASFTTTTGQWPDVLEALSVKVLGELWDQKYQNVYFAGVYSFEEPKYVSKPELGAQIHEQLRTLDKDNNTLRALSADSFSLTLEAGKLVVAYPNRAADVKNDTKAAIIIGELLYESRNGYATFSLRAIDASNMHVVANQVMELSIDPATAKLLGLPAYKVMAKRIVPVVVVAPPADASASKSKTAAKPAEDLPPPALSVNLQDPNDFLSKAKQANRVFRVMTLGHANTLENRFASLALKSYMHDLQEGIAISDQDFVSLALTAANPSDNSAAPADVNAAWVLPDLTDLNTPSIELDSLKARDLSQNRDTTIGKLTIQRSLPRLALPSADDLRSAGYSASK